MIRHWIAGIALELAYQLVCVAFWMQGRKRPPRAIRLRDAEEDASLLSTASRKTDQKQE